MDNSGKVERVEKVVLTFERPRVVGRNARRGVHGDTVTDPVVRIHSSTGAVGIGWSRIDREAAQGLIGADIASLINQSGTSEAGLSVDIPLWDLVARQSNLPLYRLLGARGQNEVELYDGSVYIDDLDATDEEAVAIFREEVATGNRFGYHNFKIKIGRGARWMPIQKGTDRDVQVIHTIREAAGPDAKVLVDANNGTTLNIAREILTRTRDANLYWFEEPFAEDRALNEALKAFIDTEGFDTLVADGESGPPPPSYFDMVEAGWIDIVQHDFRAYGLSWWRKTAKRIEPWGARCAPHCWGSLLERYAHAHFAASVPNFALLEAAPAETPGIVLDGWGQHDGHLIVPDTPGTGFDIEPDLISKGVKEEAGFTV